VSPPTPQTDGRTHIEFDDWLSAFDESLASGRDTELVGADAPDDDRVRRASECLERLESLWPRGAVAAIPNPPSPEQLARLRDEELRGKSFGRFIIEREMGRGGHGVVFLAFDPALKRRVALKVPRPDVLVTADLRRRFLREAQAAAVLDHPNIVPIYETGESGPACYLAAAYCNGPTLGDWLLKRSSMIPARQAALIALKMAEALHHAHERQIFHRDVKPSNILLEPRSLHPDATRDEALPFTPKLTDFGLAKVVEEGRGDDTRTGAILGTPRYMSPEQAEGRLKDIGPATDVHGVGVTLYEMLAGQPPFMGVGDGETLHLVRTAEPTPPSKHRDGVPRDLEAICLKCLEKEVDQRYSTAQALVEDLRRFLSDQPTVARPIRWPDRVLRWARREPMGAAFALGCLLAAASIVSTWVWYTLKVQAAAEMAASFGKDIGERDRAVKAQLAAAELQLAVHDWQAGRRTEASRRIAKLEADRQYFAALDSSLTLIQQSLSASPHQPETLPDFTRRWESATLAPDGSCVIGVSRDGRVERVNRGAATSVWSLAVRFPPTEDVRWRWSPDGCRALARDAAGRWLIVDRQGQIILNEASKSVVRVPADRKSSFVGFGVAPGRGLFAMDEFAVRHSLPSGPETFTDAVLLHHRPAMMLLKPRGGFKVLDFERQEVILALASAASGEWTDAALDSSDRLVAAVSKIGGVGFWDASSGKRWLGDSSTAANSAVLRFSHDGKSLIHLTTDGRIAVWHAPTGRLILQCELKAETFDFAIDNGLSVLARSSATEPFTILRPPL
jgi:hypothetical protein